MTGSSDKNNGGDLKERDSGGEISRASSRNLSLGRWIKDRQDFGMDFRVMLFPTNGMVVLVPKKRDFGEDQGWRRRS